MESKKEESKICIASFKANCVQMLQDESSISYNAKRKTPEEIQREMGLDEASGNDLEAVCGEAALRCPAEASFEDWDNILTCKNPGLNVLTQRKKLVERQQDKVKKNKSSLCRSKYNELDCALLQKSQNQPVVDENDRVDHSELVIVVRVSYPRTPRRYKNIHFDFCVLGSQFLHELRDKICCPIDEQPIPGMGPDKKNKLMKHICTSSSFYIEDTFYTDFRKETDMDYSQIIIDWAKKNEVTHLPENMQQKSMNHTKFEDLNVVLGKGYVFLHQGNCEHELKFVDIRLIDRRDCQSRAYYPHAISRPKVKAVPCKGCHDHIARWITRNDELSDEDPSFFCDVCFEELHFDSDGQKIAEFEARPFINLIGLS